MVVVVGSHRDLGPVRGARPVRSGRASSPGRVRVSERAGLKFLLHDLLPWGHGGSAQVKKTCLSLSNFCCGRCVSRIRYARDRCDRMVNFE